jgi:hypothetical protein
VHLIAVFLNPIIAFKLLCQPLLQKWESIKLAQRHLARISLSVVLMASSGRQDVHAHQLHAE